MQLWEPERDQQRSPSENEITELLNFTLTHKRSTVLKHTDLDLCPPCVPAADIHADYFVLLHASYHIYTCTGQKRKSIE